MNNVKISISRAITWPSSNHLREWDALSWGNFSSDHPLYTSNTLVSLDVLLITKLGIRYIPLGWRTQLVKNIYSKVFGALRATICGNHYCSLPFGDSTNAVTYFWDLGIWGQLLKSLIPQMHSNKHVKIFFLLYQHCASEIKICDQRFVHSNAFKTALDLFVGWFVLSFRFHS